MIHTIDLYSAELKKEMRINVKKIFNFPTEKQLNKIEQLSTLGGFNRFSVDIYDEGKHLTKSHDVQRAVKDFLIGIMLPGELKNIKI